MTSVEPRRLGRPRQIDRPAIVAATLQPPTNGSDRWSCRELSAVLNVSEATVARVWREYGIAPRAAGQYAFTVQPELAASTVRVVGLCLTRRVRAIALLVDDTRHARNTDPRLAADDPGATEVAMTPSPEATTKVGVRDFLRRVTESFPERAVHVVVDSAHLQRLLIQSVPQLTTAGVAVHFALDTEKWLNLVDVWNGLMVRDGEDEGRPGNRVRELIDHGRTVIWVASPHSGLESGGCGGGFSYAGERLAGQDRADTAG